MSGKGTALVYGGTGFQGSRIVERLRAEGYRVRVLIYGEQPDGLEGVEAVSGSFDDAGSLIQATAGVSHVVLLLPLAFDVEAAARWTSNVLRAAELAGVQRLVFDTSVPVPDNRTGVAAIDVKVVAEALVRGASIPWTIVRPTIYLGNLIAPWSAPGIVRDHVVAYPLAADVPVSWISWEDTAVAVERALSDPSLTGHALDVGGHHALTGTELAAAFGKALGGTYAYAPIPLDGFEAGLN